MFSIEHVIFYVFAAIAVASGVTVITARNPVRSVLALVVTFFAMSGVWMLLRAEFLSLILVLVYVGAVMTLFLFVVMMLNIDTENKRSGFVRYLPFGILLILLTMGLMMATLGPQYFGIAAMPAPPAESAQYSNLQHVGALLYTDFVYPFEIAGVLLLTAIIAAITLAHHAPKRRKSQRISQQIAANAETCVRLVKMSPEPKEEGG